MNTIITQKEREILAEQMFDILNEYDYEYNYHAIMKIINTWAENKGGLITAFKADPDYVEGQFAIKRKATYERANDMDAIVSFFNWVINELVTNLNYKDALPKEVLDRIEREEARYLPSWLYNWLIGDADEYTKPQIDEELAKAFEEHFPEAHIHKGSKTSRAMGKLFRYLGYDKHPDYNRRFAKYADALNPRTFERETIISIHPCDYLTMSFGNSWSSCHTIDKDNTRRMPNGYHGMYSSGTISYMLDGTSMVLYTTETHDDDDLLHILPKTDRQMFHYEEGKLIQGRLYPNDSRMEIIDAFRQIVQETIARMFNLPNLWTFRRGIHNIYNHVASYGTHYRDYINFNNCTISFAKEIWDSRDIDESVVHIGHDPICIECGFEHRTEDNINCCHNRNVCECACCGCVDDEENMLYIDGEYYCTDCATQCPICGEWVTSNTTTYIRSEYREVCEYCLEEQYVYCECCDEYVHYENAIYVGDEYICDDCFTENYTVCDGCGEYVLNDDAHEHNGNNYCTNCLADVIENDEEVTA